MVVDLTKVGPTGYGTMRLTWNENPPSQEEAFSSLEAAIKNGYIYWDAGENYGSPERNSCHLLREYFTKHPDHASKVTLNIKGANRRGGSGAAGLGPDSSPQNVRQSVEECLKVLDGTKSIDIFECARKDPTVPIEETVQALAELVKEGKIGGIGLSEVGAETIRRAAKIHPIATVEVELSLWARDILTNGIAATCAELGIPITAYSPIARGALGQRLKYEDFADGDFRKHLPKYQPEALEVNNKMTDEVEKLAKRKGCTQAQIAISWVRSLSGRNGLPTIIPIPGAISPERVEENAKHIALSDEEMEEIDNLLKNFTPVGKRYGGHGADLMNG